MAEPQESGYQLVMPFVVVTSRGGPYDDEAFVAGYGCGLAWAKFLLGQPPAPQYVPTAAVPQYDLIAMHYGYRLVAEPWEDDPTQSLVSYVRDDDGDG